jgi:hypothetical protein
VLQVARQLGIDYGKRKSALATPAASNRQRENYFVMWSSQSAHVCKPERTASIILLRL